ncbi:hypothetical protein HRU45_01915, partial [Candidatus Dependentiae bacterium]|nr:hypothetical protein [Candidatus Dependentiae bacterium]
MNITNKNTLIIFSVALLTLIQRTQAKCTNPADLDRTFGPQNNGIVLIDFGGVNLGEGGLVIDDQGRIVVCGVTLTSYIPPIGSDFAVARLLPNGLLDTSFGPSNDGKVTIDFGGTDLGTGGVVRDTQGRLIVAGYEIPSFNFAVTRLLENGSLDSSFAGDGTVVGMGNNIRHISGIKLNKEGKIVLFGYTTGDNLIVIQLNTDGSLDASFGTAGTPGIQEIGFGGRDITRSDFIIDTQGRIVIVGYTDVGSNPTNFAIARLNADGSFDTTFGSGGQTTVNIGDDIAEGGIALTRSGKIVILGTNNTGSDNTMVAFQLNDDGSLDTTFGTNGSTTVDLGVDERGNRGITIDSWGNIYLYGIQDDPGQFRQFLVARLTKNGSLDTSFGNNGTQIIKVDTSTSYITTEGEGGIAIDAQGRIVLLGSTLLHPPLPNVNFAVVRLCGDQLP